MGVTNKIMQKGQVQIILIGVLVIVALVSGVYYLGRQASPKPTPAPVVTYQTPQPTLVPDANREPSSLASPKPSGIDETANWKTYTNTKLGYSLKYPPNWGNDLDKGPTYSLHPPLPETPPDGGLDYLFSGISIYEIDKEYNPKGLSLEEYAKTQYIQGDVQRSTDKISLSGSEGVKDTHIWDSKIQDISIYINHNSKIYLINLSQTCSFPEVCVDVNTFDQILSTFKFTN